MLERATKLLKDNPGFEHENRRFDNSCFSAITDNQIIHRKASCPCGGGCPACQENSGHLKISQPNDPAEIEADQIADRVMRMSVSDAKPMSNVSNTSSTIHRKCNACENEEKMNVQRKPLSTTGVAASDSPDHVRSAISSGGQSLDSATRRFFEPRYGYDLGRVRIHTGDAAAESARKLNASAYTFGQDIVFGASNYAPDKHDGRTLIAHELTHVLQQSGSGAEQSTVRRQVDQRDEPDDEKLGTSVGLTQVCQPHPKKVKQAGATCWAAALLSVLGSRKNVLSSPDEYVEKYKEFTYKDGSLSPKHWADVANSEGMQFTDEVTAEEITSAYLWKRLTGYGELCRPLWVAESGDPFAHAYVVFGIERHKMVRMDPMIGDYNVIDVRQISESKKFKVSFYS
ncbi:MAG: DUF4157 domain-containing protein [Pyrinomonadaceae bacterium]